MSTPKKPHWLQNVKLPAKACHRSPIMGRNAKGQRVLLNYDYRDVIVSAMDTQGAIVRRPGRMRYFAPLEEIHPVPHGKYKNAP